jgi:Patatin-like phospholipase
MATFERGPLFEFEILEDELLDRFGDFSQEYQKLRNRRLAGEWDFSPEHIKDVGQLLDELEHKLSVDVSNLRGLAIDAQKCSACDLLNQLTRGALPKPVASEKFGDGSYQAEMLKLAASKYGERSAQGLKSRLLLETELRGLLPAPTAFLKAIRREFHRRQPAALCLSGGGIRSATFALGVIQGLAQAGLLEKFTFISTVSGGGYIGGWLSTWMHRRGGPQVVERLRQAAHAEQDEQPAPITFLREYSNYLTPHAGMASADSWAAFGGTLRNIILNWTVFVPLLFALAVLPMLTDPLICLLLRHLTERMRLLIALAVTLPAILYMSAWRPSLEPPKSEQKAWCRFQQVKRGRLWSALFGGESSLFWRCLLLLSASAFFVTFASFSLAWRAAVTWPLLSPLELDPTGRAQLIGLGLAAFAIGWLIPIILSPYWTGEPWLMLIRHYGSTILYVSITGAFWGLLQWFGFGLLNEYAEPIYYCFGPALSLLTFLLAATFFVGLISKRTTDEDREWWARLGGYVLLIIIGWSTLCFTSIGGPILLHWLNSHYFIGSGLYALLSASGVSALWAAHSGTTKGDVKADEPSGLPVSLSNLITIGGAVFFLFLMSLAAWLVIRLTGGWPTDLDLGSMSLLTKGIIVELGFKTAPNDVFAFWSGDWTRVAILILGVIIGSVAARILSVNRFSLHALYRSRLIRAYLGASNPFRQPNSFTGFDPNDNVRMHELRLIHADAIKDLNDACLNLQKLIAVPGARPLLSGLAGKLEQKRKELDEYPTGDESEELKRQFAAELDRLVREYLDELSKELSGSPAQGEYEARRENVLRLIRQRLHIEVGPGRLCRPLHVINMTLNLVGGKNLAWQERKGESFTVTALHSGNSRLGYRDSLKYGAQLSGDLGKGPSPGISLGTCVAISGAAASPNMGYFSSPVMTLLMTLFNVRLGWWLGNPGSAGEKTFFRAEPKWSMRPFLAEALGRTNDDSYYIYLSDGGHFENLGLYEMVRRRCHFIIISDASADPDYQFSDLGGAIQKIRVDQGIDITFHGLSDIRKYSDQKSEKSNCSQADATASEASSRRYAIGIIDYRAVDGNDVDNGIILYIKPTIIGDEPADVFNYWKRHGQFPHQSTANQWFSESQFESYRALGLHSFEMSSLWL